MARNGRYVCYNRDAMSEKIKSFLRGAGTVLQLSPPADTSVARPDFMRVPSSQRLASDWARVGQHMHRAVKATIPKSPLDRI